MNFSDESPRKVIQISVLSGKEEARIFPLELTFLRESRWVYCSTGISEFFCVNSIDACVFSQAMCMVQLPPV